MIRQQYNGHNLDEEIVRSILTFSFFITMTIGVLALCLALLGLDPITALTGAATAVCNVGPGLGEIIGPAGNFSTLPTPPSGCCRSACCSAAWKSSPCWCY